MVHPVNHLCIAVSSHTRAEICLILLPEQTKQMMSRVISVGNIINTFDNKNYFICSPPFHQCGSGREEGDMNIKIYFKKV